MMTRVRLVAASVAVGAATLVTLHVISAWAWRTVPPPGMVNALYIGPSLVAGHETPAGPARVGAATWLLLFLVELGARALLVPPRVARSYLVASTCSTN